MSDVNLSTLPLSRLSDDETMLIRWLLVKLKRYQRANRRQDLYFNMLQDVRDLGIAIPPHLRDLEAAIGWCALTVNALIERLRQDGWEFPGVDGDMGFGELDTANMLTRELRVGAQLAMRHGVSFGVAGAGDENAGEPKVLATVEPATRMTATWDHRRKGVTEALLINSERAMSADGATLWQGEETAEVVLEQGRWKVVDRNKSVTGRPPIVRFVNRYGADRMGRSEITRALRSYTDHAVRTIVAMEVSRDFHAAPKFWLLGADSSQFAGSAWETYMGRLNALPAELDGDGKPIFPKIEMFHGASPAPFIEQLRALAQLASAEGALPISYMGIVHDANPASADAAHVAEARLNLRVEERQDDFGDDRALLAKFMLWIRDGEEPKVTPRPIWRPAATPTLAAAADATQKLVAAKILPPDSEITLRRIGLTASEIVTLKNEQRRSSGSAALRVIADRAAGSDAAA